jgi:predicted DNA-binding transcriptional regulator AlpA
VTDREYLSADELEQMTGTPASTWRYWASIGSGPPSLRLGRRRVWKRSSAIAWIESQPATTAPKTVAEHLDAADTPEKFGSVLLRVMAHLDQARYADAAQAEDDAEAEQ